MTNKADENRDNQMSRAEIVEKAYDLACERYGFAPNDGNYEAVKAIVNQTIDLIVDEAVDAVDEKRMYEGNWESIDWNKPLDAARKALNERFK